MCTCIPTYIQANKSAQIHVPEELPGCGPHCVYSWLCVCALGYVFTSGKSGKCFPSERMFMGGLVYSVELTETGQLFMQVIIILEAALSVSSELYNH